MPSGSGLPSAERNRCPASDSVAASGAGRLTGKSRSASSRGASAGSAVAPQQKPGTDAATLSSGSPVSGVNTASPQPSATCCSRPRRAASAVSPSCAPTQVSSPRRSLTTAWASAASAATSRSALRQTRLSDDEKARKDDATRDTVASMRCSPPPSISSENRQGRPAAASPVISSAKGRALRGPSIMSSAP